MTCEEQILWSLIVSFRPERNNTPNANEHLHYAKSHNVMETTSLKCIKYYTVPIYIWYTGVSWLVVFSESMCQVLCHSFGIWQTEMGFWYFFCFCSRLIRRILKIRCATSHLGRKLNMFDAFSSKTPTMVQAVWWHTTLETYCMDFSKCVEEKKTNGEMELRIWNMRNDITII